MFPVERFENVGQYRATSTSLGYMIMFAGWRWFTECNTRSMPILRGTSAESFHHALPLLEDHVGSDMGMADNDSLSPLPNIYSPYLGRGLVNSKTVDRPTARM